MTYIPGESQVADIATKPINRSRILFLLGLLGLRLESKEAVDGTARAVSRLAVSGAGVSVKGTVDSRLCTSSCVAQSQGTTC